MAPPRVSVIIIVYNGETYLAEAIDSVLAQTWPDYELLVVDDGSHDGSRELTQSYVDAHPERVRLLRHPGGVNRGMSATRNLGLTHAKGELVAFLDADDIWAPGKLAEQVAKPLTAVDSIKMYGSGNAQKLVKETTSIVDQVASGLKDSTGIDLPSLLNGLISNPNTDADPAEGMTD